VSSPSCERDSDDEGWETATGTGTTLSRLPIPSFWPAVAQLEYELSLTESETDSSCDDFSDTSSFSAAASPSSADDVKKRSSKPAVKKKTKQLKNTELEWYSDSAASAKESPVLDGTLESFQWTPDPFQRPVFGSMAVATGERAENKVSSTSSESPPKEERSSPSERRSSIHFSETEADEASSESDSLSGKESEGDDGETDEEIWSPQRREPVSIQSTTSEHARFESEDYEVFQTLATRSASPPLRRQWEQDAASLSDGENGDDDLETVGYDRRRSVAADTLFSLSDDELDELDIELQDMNAPFLAAADELTHPHPSHDRSFFTPSFRSTAFSDDGYVDFDSQDEVETDEEEAGEFGHALIYSTPPALDSIRRAMTGSHSLSFRSAVSLNSQIVEMEEAFRPPPAPLDLWPPPEMLLKSLRVLPTLEDEEEQGAAGMVVDRTSLSSSYAEVVDRTSLSSSYAEVEEDNLSLFSHDRFFPPRDDELRAPRWSVLVPHLWLNDFRWGERGGRERVLLKGQEEGPG
jgi:hypothetical protein